MGEITPQLLALQLVTGIALGALYALLAIGLSLIFGMLTVVNFAHGAFYMVGAFLGVYFLSLTGNFWLSLVLTPFLGPLAPVLFYVANGWLLGREFFQMAARRHLPEPQATALRKARTVTVTALGVLIAFALTIPVVNIGVPVLAVASFTHLYHLLSGSVDRAA